MSARDFLNQSRTNPAFKRAHDLRTDAECYDEVSRQEAVDTKAATREEEVQAVRECVDNQVQSSPDLDEKGIQAFESKQKAE